MMQPKNWSEDSATGGSPVICCHPAIIAAVACAFLIGTGGVATSAYLNQRQEMGYKLPGVTYSPPQLCPLREPRENLAHIRSIFRPSMSELATMFGVTRQTIYNWMAGEKPSHASAEKLNDLAKAADVFWVEGVSTSSYLVRRKLNHGKTIAEIVREGGSAQDAARMMIQNAQKELAQREAMNRLLAKRTPVNQNQAELGVPMLDEES